MVRSLQFDASLLGLDCFLRDDSTPKPCDAKKRPRVGDKWKVKFEAFCDDLGHATHSKLDLFVAVLFSKQLCFSRQL